MPTVGIRSSTTWIVLPPNNEDTIGEPLALNDFVKLNGGAEGLLVAIFGYNRASA